MKIASDNYINGERSGDTTSDADCFEISAIDGSVWAHVVFDSDPPDKLGIIRAKGAVPETIAVRVNPSGIWPTVPFAGGEVSARHGYPRLVIP